MLRLIGIGSPFGDDRIGLLLIDELRPYLGEEIELVAADRPGSGLLNLLHGADQVVIIDAVVSGAEVGTLHRWPDGIGLDDAIISTSSHSLGLAQSLALGRQLALLPQALLVLGIEIDPVAKGETLSPKLNHELPGLLRQLRREISRFCGRH